MASNISLRNLAILAFAFSLTFQATLGGGIECEKLDEETCSYAVSSTGKRCVLEKQVKRGGQEAYTCRTSEIEAEKVKGHVETEDCIKACGLDRKSLGISSDSLLESGFTHKLCSPQCYHACPNVVDLYFNLAAGEGVFLPKLCEAAGKNTRRAMAELKSSGIVAPSPLHSMKFATAATPEPQPLINSLQITAQQPLAPAPY
ncbi:PAR1 protein [Senna tora]|uniref:PAR1 protein n=1 Tax=Senna tora TaxID=362788 RepID=A0A834WDI1_9FABA|nr:PAR1 protein [Senna tora]